MSRPPKILVFDSGLGGLTVFSEIAKLRPAAHYLYCADDAGFPYGAWKEPELITRVVDVIGARIAADAPDMIVIACNTASTLVLPDLRARWPEIPFIGTVPAIKPAAEGSTSRLISVLATPGTVKRDYTQNLIAQFAAHCRVNLVGSTQLARLAEEYMHKGLVCDEDIAAEIAPCFETQGNARTDAVVLACTHYPLLKQTIEEYLPVGVKLLSQGDIVAESLADYLQRHPEIEKRCSKEGGRLFYTTDSTTDFDQHATVFFGQAVTSLHVDLDKVVK